VLPRVQVPYHHSLAVFLVAFAGTTGTSEAAVIVFLPSLEQCRPEQPTKGSIARQDRPKGIPVSSMKVSMISTVSPG